MKPGFCSLGLIGYPLAYSLSPRLHSAALQAMRLAGDYRLYPVPPLPEGEELLHDLLEQLRNNELRGLNVTIPYKQAIIPYLDELSPTASAIGAVNTVFVQGGRLVGENTDAPGFLSDLEKFLSIALISLNTTFLSKENRVDKKSAILLGAGGAARAVTYALVHTGWEVTISARRLEQAQDVANTLRLATTNLQTNTLSLESLTTIGSINIIPLNKSSIIDLKPKLVVNATPVGMWPEVNASPWPEEVPFPTGALVYDLVYNPVETAFMRAAWREGLPVANGLGMLIEQAALALDIWTGQPVPRHPMWEAMAEFSGLPPD